MSKRRVVVTGLGIVSPVGSDIATAWAAILAGRSGIKPITRIDATPFATRFAGEVEGFDVASYISPKEARRMAVTAGQSSKAATLRCSMARVTRWR